MDTAIVTGIFTIAGVIAGAVLQEISRSWAAHREDQNRRRPFAQTALSDLRTMRDMLRNESRYDELRIQLSAFRTWWNFAILELTQEINREIAGAISSIQDVISDTSNTDPNRFRSRAESKIDAVEDKIREEFGQSR